MSVQGFLQDQKAPHHFRALLKDRKESGPTVPGLRELIQVYAES